MKVIYRVENLLRADPSLRNSDKRLLLAYWEQQGLYLSEQQKDRFFKCTTPETITRARRLLKEKYPSSLAVDDARFEKYKDFKNAQAVSWINDD